MRVCSVPGCPTLVPKAGRCAAHARPNANARGYDAEHQRIRASWQRLMDSGQALNCWRCGQPIVPTSWDLGHDDGDRTIYRGPEHPACNRATSSRQ